MFGLTVVAMLGATIWFAVRKNTFGVFLGGLCSIITTFYIFTHIIGFNVVLYSILKHYQNKKTNINDDNQQIPHEFSLPPSAPPVAEI